MTTERKLNMLQALTGESDLDVLSTYLDIAGGKIVNTVYPFGDIDEVPEKYAGVQVEIAAYMLNKRGAEGELSHSENGITRTYDSGDIPNALLRKLTPMVSVVTGVSK